MRQLGVIEDGGQCGGRDRAFAEQSGPRARAVDDGRRPLAPRRPAVENEVDRVAEAPRRCPRPSSGRHAGDVRGRHRQRPDSRGERAGRRMVGDADADRRRPAGEDSRQARRRARCGRTSVSPPGQLAAASTRAAASGIPTSAAWSGSASSSTIARSGGRCLASKRRSMPPRRVERDADAVDRVGRERNEAACAQDVDRPRLDRLRRRGRHVPSSPSLESPPRPVQHELLDHLCCALAPPAVAPCSARRWRRARERRPSPRRDQLPQASPGRRTGRRSP